LKGRLPSHFGVRRNAISSDFGSSQTIIVLLKNTGCEIFLDKPKIVGTVSSQVALGILLDLMTVKFDVPNPGPLYHS